MEAVDHGVEASCDNSRHRYEVCYPDVEVMDVSYGVHPQCEGIGSDAREGGYGGPPGYSLQHFQSAL